MTWLERATIRQRSRRRRRPTRRHDDSRPNQRPAIASRSRATSRRNVPSRETRAAIAKMRPSGSPPPARVLPRRRSAESVVAARSKSVAVGITRRPARSKGARDRVRRHSDAGHVRAAGKGGRCVALESAECARLPACALTLGLIFCRQSGLLPCNRAPHPLARRKRRSRSPSPRAGEGAFDPRQRWL